MPELADRLTRFRRVVGSRVGNEPIRAHLRFPRGSPSTFQGSELGAELWGTLEGTALLELTSSDPQVLGAFGGHWFPEREARSILANAVEAWQKSGQAPEEFASAAEHDLWSSLRRADIQAIAVGIVEDVTAPPQGIALPYGRAVYAPDKGFMQWVLARAWPEYHIFLPSRPYSLFVANVLVPRAHFGGEVTPAFAKIAVDLIRDAVWLATGAIPRLGHMVAWEESIFPVAEPQHYPPEVSSNRIQSPVQLEDFRDELFRLVPRVAVLQDIEPNILTLDSATRNSLDTIRFTAATAIRTANTAFVLLMAFAAADGSLRDPNERTDAVPNRFGLLCGTDDQESRNLRRSLERLNPIRNAIAHGDLPTQEEVTRFLGRSSVVPSSGTTLWTPSLFDQMESEARAKAIDLLRRLYRGWLLAAIEIQNGNVLARFTRDQLLRLLRSAQHGDVHAIQTLRQLK